jgi:hypothetical protein
MFGSRGSVRSAAAALAVVLLAAGCVDTGAGVDQIDAVAPADGAPVAGRTPQPETRDGTAGRDGVANGPRAGGGTGGAGGTARAADSPDGRCRNQPMTYSPMSKATLKKMPRYTHGFRMRVVDPSTTSGIVSPHQVARKPWTHTDWKCLTSWELALGRVSLDLPCKELSDGRCKPLVADKLVYLEVRQFFGKGDVPHCCAGNPQPIAEDVHSFSWWFTPAETGLPDGSGWKGDGNDGWGGSSG